MKEDSFSLLVQEAAVVRDIPEKQKLIKSSTLNTSLELQYYNYIMSTTFGLKATQYL